MARPRKNKVDYFPHTVRHGKTMEILEDRYGNNGYAFWFKLLERLGDSEGHFLDLKNQVAWEYLQTKTRQTPEICTDILNLLATLEAIDPILWKKEKIVWSDNFLAGIADVYAKRTTEIPCKPGLSGRKQGEDDDTGEKTPQSKEKKSKEKKSNIAQPFFSCKFFEVDSTYRDKLAKEYPILTDAHLLNEFSKMEDWIEDNKHTKKFKANGRLGNAKLFIRNWIERQFVIPGKQEPPKPEPKPCPCGSGKWENVCCKAAKTAETVISK